MSPETQPNLPELVLTALETAMQSEGESRLVSVSKKTGLLPGGAASAAKTLAKKHCTDPELNLFTVREVNEGAKVTQFCVITENGIESLFQHRAPAVRAELAKRAASTHLSVAKLVLARLAEKELHELNREWKRLGEQADELRVSLSKLVSEQLEAVESQRELLASQAEKLRALVSSSRHEPTVQVDPEVAPRRSSEAKTDEAIDFQRDLCRELVFAWQDAPADSDERAALERVMHNTGLEAVGELGDVVKFTAVDHATEDELNPGDEASITEPGWLYRSRRGELLVAPAKVRKL